MANCTDRQQKQNQIPDDEWNRRMGIKTQEKQFLIIHFLKTKPEPSGLRNPLRNANRPPHNTLHNMLHSTDTHEHDIILRNFLAFLSFYWIFLPSFFNLSRENLCAWQNKQKINSLMLFLYTAAAAAAAQRLTSCLLCYHYREYCRCQVWLYRSFPLCSLIYIVSCFSFALVERVMCRIYGFDDA